MVTVPTYGGQKATLNPLSDRRQTSGVTAQSAGAGVGQAVERLGQQAAGAINTVDAAMTYVRDLEDKAHVDARLNAYSDFARERTYDPDKGYLTMKGQNAVEGREAFEEEMEKQRRTLGEGLNERQMLLYNRASEARQAQSLDTAIRHAAGERKVWLNSTSEARIENLSQDALAASDDPAKLQENMTAGINEMTDMATRNGWPKEMLEQKTAEFNSSVHMAIAAKHAPTDPLRAQAWIDANKDSMTPEAYNRTAATLAPAVLQAQAINFADGVTMPRPPRVKPDNAAMATSTDVPQDTPAGRLTAAMSDSGVTIPQDEDGDGAVEIDTRTLTTEQKSALTQAAVDAGYTGVGFGAGVMHLDMGEKRAWGEGGEIPEYARESVSGFGTTGKPGPIRIYEAVAGIENPLLRRAAAQELASRQAAEDTFIRRQERNAQIEAEKFIVANPGRDPRTMPLEQQKALGLQGMNKMISYYELTKAGTVEIKTDEVLYANLEREAYEDPTFFANYVSLFDYVDRLSTKDRRELQTLQAKTLKADRDDKAKSGAEADKSAKILTAMSIADEQLEALDIFGGAGKKATADDRLKRARFQRALSRRMREFQEQNDDRVPNDFEVREIVDELLLPVVLRSPGRFGGVKERDSFVFDAPYREDDQTVQARVPYEQVPFNMRFAIREELAKDLGREPTDEEVGAEYALSVLR